MQKKKIFWLLALAIFLSCTPAYAEWQIDISEWASRANYNYGPMRRGHFATRVECENARRQMAQQAGDSMLYEYSECVGYDEDHDSASASGSRSGVTYLGRDSEGNPRWSVSGSSNTSPDQEQRARRRRATLAARLKGRRMDSQVKEMPRNFDREKEDLLARLKGGHSDNPKIKSQSLMMPLKKKSQPQSSKLREETIKAIKQLHCSAYWGLAAAREALGGEASIEKAKLYGEYSARAKNTGDISSCPEVKISVPDVPPPVDANPQVRLYRHIIEQTEELIPEIIETHRKLTYSERRLKRVRKMIDIRDRERKKLEQELKKKKSEEEQETLQKKRRQAQQATDELERLAKELEKEASEIKKKADAEAQKVADLQNLFDTISEDPQMAEKIMGKDK